MVPFVFILSLEISIINGLGYSPQNKLKMDMCTGGPSSNATENTSPIYEQTQLKQISVCPNGELYEAGPDENHRFQLLRVHGTPYQMGYGHGVCLQESVKSFQSEFWDYLSSQLSDQWKVPKSIANDTIKTIIDERIAIDKIFIPNYIIEELQGLSDGSGVPYMDLLRFHVSSELNGFHCSMFGAYGNATKSNNGQLLQLRALDYDTDGPQRNYPLITVYNPSDENAGHQFATIGAVSFIGSITGISSKQISICEIGVDCPDASFGNTTVNAGHPFVFLLRDILQFDESLDSATKRLETAHRTVDLILGVGDNKIKNYENETPFHGYQYSGDVLNVFNYNNLEPDTIWHPKFNDIIYWGMDWDIAGYDMAMAQQFDALYGNITAENSIQYITALVQTGDFHIAIYDYTNNRILLSFHSKNYPNKNNEEDNAYNRQFTSIPLDILF